jgi:hypothetical protein
MKTGTMHLSVTVGLFAMLMFVAQAVFAQNAHFIDSKTTANIESDGDLTVKFKEAGLGDTATTYSLTTTADVTCTCVTNSGRCPKAANKLTFASQASTQGTFDPKNGTVSATLTLTAPGCPASSSPTCGGGQTLELSAIAYHNIALTDITHNVSASGLPTELSTTLFTCP